MFHETSGKLLVSALAGVVAGTSLALTSGFAIDDAADELPVLVRSFAEVDEPAPPFANGVFEPRDEETIAFIGGTNTFDQQRAGDLEMRFQLAWPERRLRFRNLGWQGDTLYHQARPRFFYTRAGDPQPGSSPDIRERTEPGIIFINFGKVESLDGAGSLPGFVAAYAELLDHLQARSGRIVVILPTPFFAAGPAAPLAESRNAGLGQFVTAVRKLASERGLRSVDLFTPLLSAGDPPLSDNGIHLNDAGHAAVAEHFARQLDFPETGSGDLDRLAESSVGQSLRQAIQRKDRLWHQYYHPTNWAFLFGDRQHVPASRDHVDTRKRWFVDELKSLPPLIAETEDDIHRYAREASNADR